MFMVTNCKIRAMKKFITSIFIAAAALSACNKINEPVAEVSDKVSFNIEAAMPQTRTALVENNGTYSAMWKAGDTYSIVEVGDGANKQNGTCEPIAEDAAVLSAKVTVAAKSYSKYEYFFGAPKASMNGACTYMALTLPAEQAPATMNTFDGLADFLVGKPLEFAAQPQATDVLNFQIARVSAIGKVTVKGVTLAEGDKVTAVKLTFAQLIAGKITKLMTDDLRAGIYPVPFAFDSSAVNYVKVTLPEAQTGDFTYFMCCWPQTVAATTAYTVDVTTELGNTITKSGVIPSDLVFSAGDITSFTINMATASQEPDEPEQPEQPIEKPAYITVAGVKWAAGNLQYELNGTADEGFAAGWRIANNQASYQNENTTSRTDYNKSDLFNFGGVEDPFSPLATASAVAAVGTDISGKLYTDQACTATTTDFAAAKYGDIAFWASNGKYRMPTEAEYAALLASASAVKATYTLNGANITGIYFFNPEAGATPTIDVANIKTLTDDDLKVGIFLPWAGRGYNAEATQYDIYKAGEQGIYRASVVNTGDGANQPCYGVVFACSNVGTNKVALPYWNKAFDAKGRYSIRPVLVE